MDLKEFKFSIKDLSDSAKGEFTGFASIYGNEDLVGDVVMPGAFSRTIKTTRGEIPILWQHDPQRPIGMGKLEDSERGLKISGKLNMDLPLAQEAFSLLKPLEGFKQAAVNGLSIGYDVVKDFWVGKLRELKEIKLYEVSLVTFPANPKALVGSVKNEDRIGQLEQKIEDIQATLLAEGLIADPDSLHSGIKDNLGEGLGTVNSDPDSLHSLMQFSKALQDSVLEYNISEVKDGLFRKGSFGRHSQ